MPWRSLFLPVYTHNLVQNDGRLIAHFVTSLAKIDGTPDSIEVHVIVNQTAKSEAEEAASLKEGLNNTDDEPRPAPFLHSTTTNLSDANKQGLDSLSYWRNGPKASKVYIFNQALTQYLAQYKESQWPIPSDENT